MVNIDTVYQTVLAIANKEQRGYVTPQEFNLFANQAQMEIFEQYFYDENQFSRIPGNSTEYSDMLDLLKEKISIFKQEANVILSTPSGVGSFPFSMYRLGNIHVGPNEEYKVQEVNKDELLNINNSIIAPTLTAPVFVKNNNEFIVYPIGAYSNSIVTYIKSPAPVNWGYNVIDENAIYYPNSSVHFELHPSEQTSLVMKILSYAGVTLKDNTLYQIGEASEVKKTQQEKQ